MTCPNCKSDLIGGEWPLGKPGQEDFEDPGFVWLIVCNNCAGLFARGYGEEELKRVHDVSQIPGPLYNEIRQRQREIYLSHRIKKEGGSPR